MQSPLSTLLFAAIYHEGGRPSVAAGNTLAHSVGQARPFTEFADLEPDAQHGRMTTAGLILAAVEPWCPATGSQPLADAVDWLARIIHNAERTAIENGWVVIKLNPPRPWIPFDELPEVAQAGRRGQATYLLSRFGFRDVPALGSRDNGDPARTSPSAA